MGLKARPVLPPSGPTIGFSTFLERAIGRKGADELEQLLLEPMTTKQARSMTDDRVLSMMSKIVFCAGFAWKVVDAKWPGFEAAFDGFDPRRVAAYDGDQIDDLARDKRIVRNRAKINATVDNARFVLEIADEHGSFANWVASWSADDTIGLWRALKTRGNRLGGFTGPLFLRHIGVDTFMLSGDVVKALIGANIVDKHPTSQRDLRAVQAAFSQWRDESKRPLAHISRILACSVD